MATVRKIRKIVRRDSGVVLRSPSLASLSVPAPAPVTLRSPTRVEKLRAPMPVDAYEASLPVRVPAPAPLPGLPPVDRRLTERAWHVFVEGGEPVGPVSADQIARGVRAGKVPSDATVRHERDLFWADLLDVPEIVLALKRVSPETEAPPQSLPPNLILKQFFVWTDGGDPVGPVSTDQIARGIRAGKVPSHASVQRVGELFATDVLDEPEIIAALKLV